MLYIYDDGLGNDARRQLVSFASGMTDDALVTFYNSSVADILTFLDDIYELGFDVLDIGELRSRLQYIYEKTEILACLCIARGITLVLELDE